ncbi:MAG TPA: amidohydrolase [Terriglobia bacterium]|nr:amidohydrolase [Terriglobia bacterium]
MGLTPSRRQFLGALGALALRPLDLSRVTPSLILYNANIITVNARQPRAQALAIADGRILAVGSNDEVKALASGGSPKLDLEGKTVLPGFIDAHAHPAASGREHLRMVACDSDSIEAIQAALRQRAAQTLANGWVLGFLYDDGKTPHPLTRAELDAAVPDHPVLVRHRGGHTVFVNSRALALAGVNESTPVPSGGRFARDASGRHNGYVADHATGVFDRLFKLNYSRDDYRAGVKLISKMFARHGVTSVGDATTSTADLQAYQDARDAGELGTRVYCLMQLSTLDRMIAAGIHTGFGDDWVRVGALKQFADGSISERTARLSQPYEGMPGYFGLVLESPEELYQNARKAHAADWQLATHANGDVAIDTILSVYERVQKELPRPDPRFRIEHCTLLNQSLIERMRALKVIPVTFSCYVYFHGDVMHFYGEERLKHMFAMRDLIDAGLNPPDSSDYTASPSEPMMWLQSQVTRTDYLGHTWGANQRITVDEAIRAGTINGAYASFEEHRKGSLEAGKLADLVVLGQDPTRVEPGALIHIPVERTMVGGRWVFEA